MGMHHSAPQRDSAYFALGFGACRHEGFTVVNAPANIVRMIETICDEEGYTPGCCWGSQIASYKLGACDFRLNFLCAEWKHHAIRARILLSRVLSQVMNHGYVPVASTCLMRDTDRSAWIFKRVAVQPQCPFVTSPMLCIGISSYDSLHVLDPRAVSVVSNVLKSSYAPGIQRKEGLNGGSGACFKLEGYPWRRRWMNYEEHVHGQKLVADLFTAMHRQGYSFYTSCNFKGTADTMYFVEDAQCSRTSNFAAISMTSTDHLYLTNLWDEEVVVVRTAIQRTWPRGIQEEGRIAGSYDFKLKGTPWRADGEDAVYQRMMLNQIFEALRAVGWEVHCAVDLSRELASTSTIILRSCPAAYVPHMCISFNEYDKLRVLNAPREVVNVVRSALKQVYVVSRERVYGGSHEFKLGGYPWSYYCSRPTFVLGCDLFRALEVSGWKLLCSADSSIKTHTERSGNSSRTYPADVDGWFLARTTHQTSAAAAEK